jgi:hypothetical protein
MRRVMLLLLLLWARCADYAQVAWLGHCLGRQGTLRQAVQLQTLPQHSSSCSTSYSSSRVGRAPLQQQQQQQMRMLHLLGLRAWVVLVPHTIASRS